MGFFVLGFWLVSEGRGRGRAGVYSFHSREVSLGSVVPLHQESLLLSRRSVLQDLSWVLVASPPPMPDS